MDKEVNQKNIKDEQRKEELQDRIIVFFLSFALFPTLLFFISSVLYAIGIINWGTLSKVFGPGSHWVQKVASFPLGSSLVCLFFLLSEIVVVKFAWQRYRRIIILGLILGAGLCVQLLIQNLFVM